MMMLLCCYRTGRNTICPAAFFRPTKKEKNDFYKTGFDVLTTIDKKNAFISDTFETVIFFKLCSPAQKIPGIS